MKQELIHVEKSENWNKYLGDIWKDIFRKINLDKKGIVIEIAPGKENKIGNGLVNYGFAGTIYIIEPDKIALKYIVKRYSNSMKGVSIIGIPLTLDKAIKFLPYKVDAIVANHPLDDMLIGKALGNIFDEFFTRYYNTKECKTSGFWKLIKKYLEIRESLIDKIVLEWEKLIKETSPNFAIISQYESYFFKKHGIKEPDKYGLEILEKIRKSFKEKEQKSILHQEKRIKHKKRWLVLKP